MSQQHQQRYTFEKLQSLTNDAIMDKNMPKHLYRSVNSISKVLDAIIQTRGEGWTHRVLDENGQPILTKEEQERFQRLFAPYIDSILVFFDSQKEEQHGGKFNPAKASGLTKDFLKKKEEEVTGELTETPPNPTEQFGIDEVYEKLLNRVQDVDKTVNSYASKYGILKLEKQHDLDGDIQIIPEPAQLSIADLLFTASSGAILPEVTQDVLKKVKVPFRIIVVGIYLALDIVRLSVGVLNMTLLRKIMSIIVALIELLRGEWKKSILTFMGYFGMTPMLFGSVIKVFLTMFQMLAPQLQEDILLGVLDSTKSFIIGVMLSIFQIAAPEEIRLPVIGALERIAQMKAKLDGVLVEAGMSARPDYLAPTFADLNNIQSVFSDEAIVCSAEFQEAIQQLKNVTLLKIVLELMRIPTTDAFYNLKCGPMPPKTFVERVGEEASNRQKVEAPITTENFEEPVVGANLPDKDSQGQEEQQQQQQGGKRTLRMKGKRIISS